MSIQSGTSLGSQWLTNSHTPILSSYSPTDGQLLGKVRTTSSAQLEQVITSSQQAFHTWRMVPAPKRGEFIRLLGNALRKHKHTLGTLVSREMGKSKQEGDGEVQEMIDMADFAVGQARMLYGRTMHSERCEHRMYEQWHPLGVVGVISAFNFPVAVWSWNAFIAAICGNTVIWRPSPRTPLCALYVQQLCNEIAHAHEYPAVFSLVISDEVEQAQRFVADERLSLISFTGSTAVGRSVAGTVAQRFGRCILELSGNNAAIIDDTADLKRVIPSVVFGAVGTAGQRCTSLRRLLIQRNHYEEVLQQLIAAYAQLKIGDPTDQYNHVGPLIDEAAVIQFQQAIEAAKHAGGEVLFGGQVIDLPGYFVQPTIIAAQPDWNIVNQETFAPILYVMPYDTLEEAIAMNNQVDHGLSSALFTQSIRHAERFLSAQGSDCGIANINIGTSGAEIGGAFGGEKHTGGGREAGSDAWKAYMRRQTNTLNWGLTTPLAQGITFTL